MAGFVPSDPAVPTIGFVDAAERPTGTPATALEIGPKSFAAAEAIEIRAGVEARDGELLWRVRRTRASPADTTGRVKIGEAPPGFDETEALDGALPSSWHVEVDNRCYFGRATRPEATLTSDAVTLEGGERVTIDAFRADDRGFSECDSSTLGSRTATFSGLVSVAIGGVLLVIALASRTLERQRRAQERATGA